MIFLVLGFILGFIVALSLYYLRVERLVRSGALFFYKNKGLFELKEEIEEELKDLLNEVRMEREALKSLKLEAELLSERLESLILKLDSLKKEDLL